jgi:hypothetical protein
MIHLEKTDKQWIKFCKGHYKSKYPFTGRWIDSLKPLFIEIYGYDPDIDGNYHNYLICMFNKLLDIHLKIVADYSGTNMQLREIFSAAFYKSISRDDDLPIERAISQLCGLIQSNPIIETRHEIEQPRYEL